MNKYINVLTLYSLLRKSEFNIAMIILQAYNNRSEDELWRSLPFKSSPGPEPHHTASTLAPNCENPFSSQEHITKS